MATLSFPLRAMAHLFRGVVPLLLLTIGATHASAQPAPSPDLRDDQFAVAYQINPAHSGGITFDKSFAPPLRVLWVYTAEGAMSYPLVARGKVFIWVSHFTDLNQDTGRLYAFDKATGAVLWQADLPASWGYAGIAYDKGRVFVVTLDGVLTAFDADSGVQQWSVKPNSFGVGPVAANGRVFLAAINASATQETLFAIDETSGSTLWSQTLEGATDVPALSGQGVFTAGCTVQAFNPATGAPFLSESGSCDYIAIAAYYRGFLYEGLTGTIFDINARSLVNAFGGPTDSEMVPAFQGRAGYLMSRGGEGFGQAGFVAFDFKSGTTLWTAAAPFSLICPIVVNDTVYGLDGAGTLHAYDRVSGTEVWNGNGGTPPQETTVIPLSGMAAGEGVLVVPIGRQLYALAP